MKPYLITYRRKDVKGTLSRIIRASNGGEALYLLELELHLKRSADLGVDLDLKLDVEKECGLLVKDVRLMDKALSR
jgi:hypothetical protein